MSSCDNCKFTEWCKDKSDDILWCVQKSERNIAYRQGRAEAIDEYKNIWDRRVKDLIDWCKDQRLIGLQQADFIFDEIAEQLKEQNSNKLDK